MAPLRSPLAPLILKRSGHASSGTDLSLGASVGIAVGVACLFSLVVIAGLGLCWRHYRSKPRRTRRTPRVRSLEAMKCGSAGRSKGSQPSKSRFGSVLLSVLSPRRRKPRGEPHALPEEGAQPRHIPDTPLPDKELEDLHEPAIELEGSVFGDGKQIRDVSPSPFEEANHPHVDAQGPVLPYYSRSTSERDSSPMRHSRQEDRPSPPLVRNMDINSLVLTVPSTKPAPPAAWHRKRTGPPPPLTIAPPIHSRSPSDAYSTYATTNSPYGYYSFNLPPLPSSSSNDDLMPDFTYGPHSSHSSHSNRSTHPLQYPPTSPQSPVSAPSMSRSDSGAQMDSPSLPPPTPTHQRGQQQHPPPSQTQRAPIHTTSFECLGPLPDNIPMPSPHQFRTTEQQQQQQQKSRASSPPPPPRIRVPKGHSTRSPTPSTGSASPVYIQDPLLHENNPFRPHHSPVNSTFSREHSRRVHHHHEQDLEVETERRQSSDSLGSNFTVEEEARIQAQIVKNLEMLGKERVIGGDDIVHIPQVSGRRYSWEDS